MANDNDRPDGDDDGSLSRTKYLEGVTPEDLAADYMSFGTGYHADVMRAVWGTCWADTVFWETKPQQLDD